MPFARVGGLGIYHEWHGAARAPGSLPVVLVMGLGGDVTAWAFQLPAFAPRHRCLVYDNRGAGRTEAPDAPWTIADMAGDLVGLLETLGVARAHLVGVSMGGAIAQEVALAAPDRVASLQLHATWAGGPDPEFRAVVEAMRVMRVHGGREAFLRAFLPWVFTAHAYRQQGAFVEALIQAALVSPHPQPLHGYLRQAAAVLDHDARDRLGQIRCPTLVSTGEEDRLTPPRMARELAARIPGARLVLLPGVGHGALWEAPDAFNALCLSFLDGPPSGRAGGSGGSPAN